MADTWTPVWAVWRIRWRCCWLMGGAAKAWRSRDTKGGLPLHRHAAAVAAAAAAAIPERHCALAGVGPRRVDAVAAAVDDEDVEGPWLLLPLLLLLMLSGVWLPQRKKCLR